MKKLLILAAIALALLVFVLAATSLCAPKQNSDNPQVATAQKADSGLEQQDHAQPTQGGTKKGEDYAREVREQPPETYVACGKSLKVTDTFIALFTLVIAIFTIGLYLDGRGKTKRELRAYIAVDLGKAFYQDGRHRFGSNPIIINSGKTPAHNVCYWYKAAILPSILGRGYVFPQGSLRWTDVTMSPRHTFAVSADIGRVCTAQEELIEIMAGDPVRLYVWGLVQYADIFGDSHKTRFCHHYHFPTFADRTIQPVGSYYETHNGAT